MGSLWEIIGQTTTFGAIILIALVLMSLSSWVVIFHKWRQFRAMDAETAQFLTYYRRTRNVGELSADARKFHHSPVAALYRAGVDELTSFATSSGSPHSTQVVVDERALDVIEMTMERTLTEEVGKLEKQVVYLAITATAAPFTGLLGTVVGIMTSFWSIGARGSATLAVVAPGIAEALLATIIGLGAAIPAVIAYNWANSRIKFANDKATGFILEFLARVKKETI
ncbi:MAG: MotA/TolQ/ExbB proton channel family protein [Candidatus Zixiibacteriota bacterium]